jgi:hypothetical protein
MLARDKYSCLFGPYINYEYYYELLIFGPGANVINLYMVAIYECSF